MFRPAPCSLYPLCSQKKERIKNSFLFFFPLHEFSVASIMSNTLWPHGLYPTRLLCPWDSPGKKTGVGCLSLLQGIFPTQVLNPCLLHWQADSLLAEPPEKPFLFLLLATNSTKLSIDRKMKTEWCTSTLQSYPALNQNRIMPVTTAWMDRVITILSRGSLRDKDTCHKVSLTGIFLKLM